MTFRYVSVIIIFTLQCLITTNTILIVYNNEFIIYYIYLYIIINNNLALTLLPQPTRTAILIVCHTKWIIFPLFQDNVRGHIVGVPLWLEWPWNSSGLLHCGGLST